VHPSLHLRQEKRDEEHALGVVEVSDGEDAVSRLAPRGVEHGADVERISLHPCRETRGGQEIVDRHHQSEALCGRIEGFQIEHPDLGNGRLLNISDQGFQSEVFPALPRPSSRLEEDMIPALHRIGVEACPSGLAVVLMRSWSASASSRTAAAGAANGRIETGSQHFPRRVDHKLGCVVTAGSFLPAPTPQGLFHRSACSAAN
jgi:hypothetical protein